MIRDLGRMAVLYYCFMIAKVELLVGAGGSVWALGSCAGAAIIIT